MMDIDLPAWTAYASNGDDMLPDATAGRTGRITDQDVRFIPHRSGLSEERVLRHEGRSERLDR